VVIVRLLSKKPVFNGRSPISRERLQTGITEGVKKADEGCEGFVGVIITHETPKSLHDTNWTIRGVKFGRADRDKASKAIAAIVEHMQRAFYLSEDIPSSEEA
jgi:hypothetical protein